MNHLLILTDSSAPSFCYYSPSEENIASTSAMSSAILDKGMAFARRNGYKVTFLIGKDGWMEPTPSLLDTDNYSIIKPLAADDTDPNIIYTINYTGDDSVFQPLRNNMRYSIILRMGSNQLHHLKRIVKEHASSFARLNLIIEDSEGFPMEKHNEYQSILTDLSHQIFELFLAGNRFEMNFLTDRLLLSHMNNCNAGLDHITLAPDGKFYLCPGFFYEGENNALGDIDNGYEIKNKHLLLLENAPVCNVCDAYHCKRCFFMNKRTTLEINTPSKTQCTLSHIERNTSKALGDRLKTIPGFTDLLWIPEIFYLDPFQLLRENPELERGWQYTQGNRTVSVEGFTDRELLMEIYQIQKEILNQLKQRA